MTTKLPSAKFFPLEHAKEEKMELREHTPSEKQLETDLEPKSTKNKPARTQKIKIGPMHILIVDTQYHYGKAVCLTMCQGITQLMVGSVNIVVLGYTFVTADVHATLCTAAWHLFATEAILAMSYSDGWAGPMSLQHKKLVHMVLQIVGLICLTIGCVIILLQSSPKPYAVHGVTGIVGLVLTLVTVISGPTALLRNQNIKVFHTSIALPSYVVFSVCLITGLLKDALQRWTGEPLAITLIVFVVLYTIFIMVTVLIKCVMRIRYTHVIEI